MKKKRPILESLKSWKALEKAFSLLLLFLFVSIPLLTRAQGYGTPTRYEAENGFNSNVTTSSANAGFSGTGYVTGLTTSNSETKFDKGVNAVTPTKIDIRYANGTGGSVTNLALYIGTNQKIADLVFPATASWSTWATLSVTFDHQPNWGSNVIIKSVSNVSTSVNIDYSDLSVSDGTVVAVATPTFSPAAGTYASAQSVTLSTTIAGATIYYTTDNSTPTTASAVYSAAISVGTSKTVKAIATKSGMSNSGVATATYTITTPPPAPGSFTQTAPASGATGVSTAPTFTWAASANASSYALVVSTNSSFTNPIINQTGLNGTSYSSGTGLANSTLYYWKVTATNATSSVVATNAGLSFTTGAAVAGGGAGFVKREYYAGISGTAVTDLTSNANFPGSPTSTTYLSSFDAPANVGSNYGQRVSGYLTAPTSGTYKFWIAADDDAQLWLSTNGQAANKVKIASVVGWTNPQEYNKYSAQASANISLVAGTQYYIEALHKEQDGGDNLTVAWQIPGGSQVTIPGSALSTVLNVAVPTPGSFTQTAPASGATGVATAPAFTWNASSNAASYTLVVSTSSAYTSPIINQTGLTATSYTPATSLAGNTLYYWKVTAINASGSLVASNAGLSFTTLVPPAPAAFTQTAPASGATGISTYPAFSWAAAANAATYALVVSTSNSYSSPIVNVSGLASTSYTATSPLATSTVYYWKVTATNGTGSTIATNAGISFTTSGGTTGTTYYVSTTGVDAPGNGTSGSPWKTLAYAASQVTAGTGNKTISLAPGTYVETACTLLPLGVNIVGAGENSTIITANGDLPSPGADKSSNDYPLWADGSLIQLKSPIYSGTNPRYGSPSQMIAPQNGSQTLSGFKIDGRNKTVKAGVWVENRSNVTLHNVTFVNLQQSGAVFTRGDMWYYEPLPEGKWMNNTSIHDLTFTNSGSTSGGEQVGNLCLGGLDGADIYNISINDPNGEGIKFQHVGHFRNTKIHDCTISVGETDPTWGEKISIELWNMSYNNEVYNIVCNTWLSMVNHYQLTTYQPTIAKPSNLKIRNVRMIDQDGVSGKEAIESALSGVEISECYIQDKGFGIAIWGGSGWGGSIANHDINIHNNIFTNVNRSIEYGFGNSAAVFVPDAANTVKIHNNVFDRMGNGLQLDNASNVSIRNNVFLNSGGDDVQGGSSLTFTNNLRYHTDAQRQNWVVSTSVNATNIKGNPGFLNTGSRWTTYYHPSAGSLVVDKGVGVGLPFSGSAPDAGRWEYSSGGVYRQATAEKGVTEASAYQVSPNPTTGIIKIAQPSDLTMVRVEVVNRQGITLISKPFNQLLNAQMDLSHFPNDLYLVRMVHQSGVITQKVVLMK